MQAQSVQRPEQKKEYLEVKSEEWSSLFHAAGVSCWQSVPVTGGNIN